ncbi:hypothetical protein CROQUDRAFT_78787 [Cronartium quercuum f. sp. fusiforme G11]|uniref:Peroxisomal ATPase PEX1 n=1 Tax=Cronartium quercuum f. sp. fusiforme G11 TaxID=708437 RepID=A0A9P6NJS6_9BASI|nr:hypothetical protein CROQUDRAFT_78787 [Cronartium quercuum f. sp. fusiforme G11]
MVRPKQANVRLRSLKTSLVNLPPSLVSQLSAQSITPQSLAIELSRIELGQETSSKSHNSLPNRLYVGWSGLPTSESTELNSSTTGRANGADFWQSSSYQSKDGPGPKFVESIEMDRSLAAEMGWQENDRLSIKFHHGMAVAKTVNVDPLTVDDWEILESNPQYLEDHFLTQIRVLAESQTLLVWLYGKTVIRVKVSSVHASHSSPNSTPHTPYLLTNETEVIVSPRSRVDANSDAKQSHQILSGDQAGEQSTEAHNAEFGIDIRRQKFKILPLSVFAKLVEEHTPSELQSDIIKSSSISPQEVTADTCMFEDPDKHPVVRINPVHFADLEVIYPSTLCCLSSVPRPNQLNPINSLTATINTHDSDHSSPIVNSKPAQPTKPVDQATRLIIAPRVRVVAAALVPIGYVSIPIQLQTSWFASHHSAAACGYPGDYEVVRFGPAKPLVESSTSHHRMSDKTLQEPDVGPSSTSATELLAGFNDHIEFCREYLRIMLATAHLYMTGPCPAHIHRIPGLLVCGSRGSGKTSLVKRIAELVHSDPRTFLYTKYVDCGKHVDDRLGALKVTLNEWFDDALWHTPSVLILDDLDKLLPAESEHIDSFRCRHWTEEFITTARAAVENRLMFLVGTASSSSSLHSLLTSGTHLFGETRNLKGLTKKSRKEILTALVAAKAADSALETSNFNPLKFATDNTEGYQPADLLDLVDRAIQRAVIRNLQKSTEGPDGTVSLENVDFQEAQSGYVPISLRDVKLEKSDVEWADIGGLHKTRKVLRETLEWPTKYAAIFAKCPLRLRSGLLLYGYPGCGKTMLASAVARECGLNFISIKGPELLNKYIGASEKSVRDLFERAQVARPCVLFFDEFDSIAPKRGHDSTGVTDRVVNQLLTQMDGAEGLEGVYVLAATSRPDLIDPALLRPGRLDQSLLCSMPDEEERKEILQAVSRKLDVDPELKLEEIARLTEGFTGADLQALVYAAHLAVVHEQIDDEGHLPDQNNIANAELEWCEIPPPGCSQAVVLKSRAEEEATRAILEQVLTRAREVSKAAKPAVPMPPPQVIIQNRHFFKALEDVRPSVAVEELTRLGKIYQNFVSSRSPTGLPNGEASEQIGGRASLM